MRRRINPGRLGVSTVGAAMIALASASIAVADPGAGVSEQASIEQLILGSISEPAAPLLYNAAQDNLVKGNYDIGFAALDAAAVAAPSDANVVALQAFYRNATGDGAGRDEALAELENLNPVLQDATLRALDIIADSAATTVDYAPVFDGERTAIVVLGYGLNGDGSIPDILIDRLESARTAAESSPESPVVVTGGNPVAGTAEADLMRDWLIDRGVDADRVHIEREADSTVQNALLSQPVLDRLGVDNVVVATSVDHVRRVISNFTIAGSTVVGAASTDVHSAPEVAPLGPESRLGLTVDATKLIGIPRTY